MAPGTSAATCCANSKDRVGLMVTRPGATGAACNVMTEGTTDAKLRTYGPLFTEVYACKVKLYLLCTRRLKFARLTVKEYDASISSFGVYPNPSDANATLVFNTQGGSGFTVEISDSHGRIVKLLPLSNLSAGKQTIGLDLSDLNAGLYVVRLTSSTGSSVLKMIVE